jgi:hypothetical protein
MHVPFDIAALPAEQAAQALPLVQATWPEMDLAAWEEFIRFFAGRRAEDDSAMLAMRDAAGYLCGILAYRVHWLLGVGPILDVHLFTAVDVTNSLQRVRALLDAAEARASALHCTGMQIRLDRSQSRLATRLSALGLSPEGALLWKRIPRPS